MSVEFGHELQVDQNPHSPACLLPGDTKDQVFGAEICVVQPLCFGVPTVKSGTVEDTQPAEFAAAVAEHIKYWERGDIDFQIKDGGQAEVDPVTKQLRTIPGAFLGYYSLVDDDTLKRFAARPEIRIISLRHTAITSGGLAHLQMLGNLEHLDLAETGVDDIGLGHLNELKSLRHLNVMGTKVTDAGIEKLKAALPGLDVVGVGSEATR